MSSNNSVRATTPLTPQADLRIIQTDGVTTAGPGGTLVYTIVVSNSGPSAVTGATVTDTLASTSFSAVTFTATGTLAPQASRAAWEQA